MEKIRITSTPPGQAPERIRNEWVGLVMPLEEDAPGEDEGIQMGVAGGKAENRGGYSVRTPDAMNALAVKSPDAVKWWQDNLPLQFVPRLVFSRDVCELVPDEPEQI